MTADVVLIDGNAITTEIAQPCWFYAWRTTELAEGGLSWLSVYRSVLVRDDDEFYRPVLDLIGDAELISLETVDDRAMMHGRAELSIYQLR